ncbi:MAG: hypothetical protein ACE5R6_17960 [Candidatus Heimdallarchaeota archaeon]
MPPSHRQVKKRLYQFMRRQLTLSKGDRSEVFQFRPRQVLRRGPLPNLALHTLAQQGVRYLILLYFANFISVYFADAQGTIVNVKNFDRQRDHQALEELPTIAKRILQYPKPVKIPSTHEQLLQKIKMLQQQFYEKIHAIEQLVGVHLPPRKIPGITLTNQLQEGVICIPAKLRTQAQLDRFFTIEAFRLFVPGVFQPHADFLTRFLSYLFVDDPAGGLRFLEQLAELPNEMARHFNIEMLARQQIRPFIALLRLWARYEDRVFTIEVFHSFIAQVLTELIRDPTRNLMEIVSLVSEVLFQGQGDVGDLLRMTCYLVLSENQALISEYRSHKVFLQKDNVIQFCQAMLKIRFRQLYTEKLEIMKRFSSPKFSRLITRALEQLLTWILRVERTTDHLTLVNQSDLNLNDVILRRPRSDPKDILATVPQLDADSMIVIHLDQNLISEQLVAEYNDNFGNRYQVPI